ncbi:MAG: hypothetical protein NTV59_01630 [Chloroflexi bacterium]|nr:hypothetical protein [Chloroflexota bacterium]
MGLQDIILIKNLTFVFRGDASKLRQDQEYLNESVAKTIEFVGKMIMMIHKRGGLSDEELTSMIQFYTQLATPNLTLALQLARKTHNPLTPEQAQKLEGYIDKAQRGLPFSYDEINDYRQLVELTRQEQTNINPWPLVALGAFLLGLWLGSKK